MATHEIFGDAAAACCHGLRELVGAPVLRVAPGTAAANWMHDGEPVVLVGPDKPLRGAAGARHRHGSRGAVYAPLGAPGAPPRALPADGPARHGGARLMVNEPIWLMVVKCVVLATIVITFFAYMSLFERKILGRAPLRPGPNRVGPMGLLQPLADVLKLVAKEDFVPQGANRVLFQMAPAMSLATAVAGLSLIPFGNPTTIFGQPINLVGLDVPIGLLLAFALSGIGFYGLILGGWASGNKYSLLGAARTAAQLVSYEVSMGLSVVGVVLLARSMSLMDIVHAQQHTVWYVLLQPVAFLIFMVAAVAETNRTPFDLPESESELVAGFMTEYGGMKFATYMMSEYLNMIVVSAIGATLFLGGFDGPFLPGWIWITIKVCALLFLFIWLRATLPRLRYDQLMRLGWKVLLPLATANLVITAIIVGVFFAK
ncbi:MAG: NADH-quinone oxidoreductase subunit NuoH [Thermoleophilia bacterium]